MYYIIAEDTGQIVEQYDRCPTQEQLQAEANAFRCAVYVIDGEHAGLSATPTVTEEDDKDEGDDYAWRTDLANQRY